MAPLRRAHCWPLCACAAETAGRLGACSPSAGPLSPAVPQEGALCSKPWLRPPGCPPRPATTQERACTGSLCGLQPTAPGRSGSSAPSVTQDKVAPPLAPPTVTQDGRATVVPGGRGSQALPGPAPAASPSFTHHRAVSCQARRTGQPTLGPTRAGPQDGACAVSLAIYWPTGTARWVGSAPPTIRHSKYVILSAPPSAAPPPFKIAPAQ